MIFSSQISVAIFALFCCLYSHASHIAIVTLADGEDYKKCVEAGVRNKREYCQKWGYDFYYFDQSLDPERHPAWNKILAVEKIMREHPEHTWVFWTDADSIIMNFSIPLEFFVDDKYNFIFGGNTGRTDYWKTHINSGEFLIKNCDWSFDLLQTVYNHRELIHVANWEQEAITSELNFNESKWMPKCKVVPYRLFNSWGTRYKQGDFIVHFAGEGRDYFRQKMERWTRQATQDSQIEFDLERYFDCYEYPLELADIKKKNFVANLPIYSIKHVLMIGMNDGLIVESLFNSCKKIESFVAFDSYDRPIFTRNCPRIHPTYTCIYNCDQPHIRIATEFLSKKYKNTFQFFEGDSLYTVPKYSKNHKQKFDLILINGNCSYEIVSHAIFHCKELADNNSILWINDYATELVRRAITECVNDGMIEISRIHSSQDAHHWVEARYTACTRKL